jgi:RNA processing factor Prp31
LPRHHAISARIDSKVGQHQEELVGHALDHRLQPQLEGVEEGEEHRPQQCPPGRQSAKTTSAMQIQPRPCTIVGKEGVERRQRQERAPRAP